MGTSHSNAVPLVAKWLNAIKYPGGCMQAHCMHLVVLWMGGGGTFRGWMDFGFRAQSLSVTVWLCYQVFFIKEFHKNSTGNSPERSMKSSRCPCTIMDLKVQFWGWNSSDLFQAKLGWLSSHIGVIFKLLLGENVTWNSAFLMGPETVYANSASGSRETQSSCWWFPNIQI